MNVHAKKTAPAPRVDGPLAEKLVKAGYDVAKPHLYAEAVKALQRANLDVAEATRLLDSACDAAPMLRLALVRAYIEQIAADMRGESLPGGVVQRAPATGSNNTLPAWHPDDVAGGQRSCSPSGINALAPPAAFPGGAAMGSGSSSAPAVDLRSPAVLLPSSGGGPTRDLPARALGSGSPAAAPPIRSDAGHHNRSPARNHFVTSPAAAGPTAGAIAGRLAAKAAGAKSLMQTFLVDGRPIGEIRFGEARRLGRAAGVTHYVLAAIVAHVQCPDETLIADAIREPDLARFIENARRDADVF